MSGSIDKRAWQIGWKLAPGHSNLVAAVAARAADTVFRDLIGEHVKRDSMEAVVREEVWDSSEKAGTVCAGRLDVVQEAPKKQAARPKTTCFWSDGDGADLSEMGPVAMEGSAAQELSLV